MADRVPVLAPDPTSGKLRFATVDANDADAVVKAGGKVLTKTEALHEEQRQAYEAAPTTSKIAGAAAGLAAGPIVGNALAGTGTITEAPEVQAFNQGQTAALTGGLDQVAVKKGLEAVAGKQAAAAYGKHQLEIAEANPEYKTAGEVTGFAAAAYGSGGLGGAARAIPGVGISALGAGAESLAARGLGGLATRGVLGRALATGGELAARGAVEGGLYGAAQNITEQQLGDTELNADKLFSSMGHGALYGAAGGAVLGGGGSLLKSAAGGTVRAIGGGLSRALNKGEQAAADLGAKAETAVTEGKQLVRGVADEAGAAVENAKQTVAAGAVDAVNDAGKAAASAAESPTGKGVRNILEELSTKEGTKGLAYDQAWGAIGKGQGLQSTRYAKQAEKYLPNGTRDVGEVMMRKGIINAEDGWLAAAKAGTPEHLLPKIEASLADVGTKIGDITSASPARIPATRLGQAFDDVILPLRKKAGFNGVADQVRSYGHELLDVLGVREATDEITVQALLEQRKALDQLVYQEAKTMDPKGRVAALRELRTKIEGVITDAMDEASGKVSGEMKAEYQALKKDYVALSIAKDAAEDSAARMSKAATFGLRDTMAALGAASSGHVLAAPVAAVGGKLLRERGQAAAAVLLHRAADMGTLAKVMRGVDDQIAKASRGLLVPPKRGPLPEVPKGTVQERANAYLQRVAAAQANPEAFIDDVGRQTEALAVNAPELAGSLSQRMVDGMAFLASKMPSPPPPDPLDPKPRPRLTDNEASKLATYGWYVDKPSRFFDEVAHGKLTFEGIEVAQALMPGAFAELQAKTAEGIATLAAQGRKPSFAERQKLGALLQFAATPAQDPQHMAFLQQNAMLVSQQATGPAPAPKRGATNLTQRSPLDRLESSGPGRR